jgi:sulfide:quinone oxidoreductase
VIQAKTLAGGISVAGQIQPEDMKALATTFRTIINNRPDGEEAGQPSSAEIEAEARRVGLQYAFIPIDPGQLTEQAIIGFTEVLADAPPPILAFCRTGTRSTSLWALSQAGRRHPEEVLKIAADAGYDLSALKSRLEERAAEG